MSNTYHVFMLERDPYTWKINLTKKEGSRQFCEYVASRQFGSTLARTSDENPKAGIVYDEGGVPVSAYGVLLFQYTLGMIPGRWNE